jgi:chlorophyll/bacteriochlorophyll a synthase
MNSPLRKPKPDYLRPLPPSELQLEVKSASVSGVGFGTEDNLARKLALVPPKARELPDITDWRSAVRVRLSLMKPITWVPVMWSFLCGAVGTGALTLDIISLSKLAAGLLMAGPLLCGMGQVVNEYFDREVDSINEPWRAIPSGKIPMRAVYQLIAFLGFSGLLVAYLLGPVVLVMAFVGIFAAHHYSAPPLRLKRFTWLGPISSATSYVLVPWLAAASVFGDITPRALILALLYTVAAVGIMVLNDFKSVRGDDALHLASVPVVFGMDSAARLACCLMDIAQFAVIAFLIYEGHWIAAAVIGLLLLPQGFLQHQFIEKPVSRAIWYNARGQNFLVLGMLVASWLTL